MIIAALPSLPDAFGNYALGEFAQIVAPAPISWWPATVGWAWLTLLAVLLLLWALWKRVKQWHARRYRREAHKRLEHLRSQDTPDTFLQELNKLLKLTAMAGYSREQVAPLSGQTWVKFLNSHCDEPPFSAEHYHWLSQGPYASAPPNADERAGLCSAATTWIEKHNGQKRDA